MLFSLLTFFIVPLILFFTLRLLALRNVRPSPTRTPRTPTRLLIILGSGGHTAEMFSLLRRLETLKYHHRSYVVSSGDVFSALKAKEFERGLADVAHGLLKASGGEKEKAGGLHGTVAKGVVGRGEKGYYGSYDVAVVPRARKVHQSLLTTPFSSLRCLLSCFAILRAPSTAILHSSGNNGGAAMTYPDLIISNGPGTAVIVILASLVLRLMGIPGTNLKMRSIYIESWARVRKLSLSGKLLMRVVDRFLVQWEGLVEASGGKGEYMGTLV